MRTLFDRSTALALSVLAAMAAALAVRAVPGYRDVFPAGGAVGFREVDPWYHVRAIEHQVANFPERFAHDPYLRFPAGGDVPVAPLFDLLAAAAVRATGGARPDSRWVESVAAWLPAVLGALVVLPAARLSWRLARGGGSGGPAAGDLGQGGLAAGGFGQGGLAAAFCAFTVALLPGQFLARSLLGFTDHHVLEVLTSTALLAALAGALDEAAAPRARRVSTLCAGLALLALLLAWVGAASIVALLALWIALQLAVDLLAGKASEWLPRCAVPALAIAAAGTALLYDGVTVPLRNLFAIVATLAAAAVLALAFRIGRAPGFAAAPRRATALAAVALCGAPLALLLALSPATRALLAGELGRLAMPERIAVTVAEADTLAALGPIPRVLWQEWGGAGPLAAAAIVLALFAALRGRRLLTRAELLLLVWSGGLLFLAFRQNRFLYYLAVPVAATAAAGVGELAARLGRRRDAASARERAAKALLVAGALVVAVGFGLSPAIARGSFWNGPGPGWNAALAWLRSSTPEPFGDAGFYWSGGRGSRAGDEAHALPRAAYAVGAWWDYGYWILRGAHRVPAADPTQAGAGRMAKLLLAADDDAALAALDGSGIRYLVLDAQLPILARGPQSAAAGGSPPRPSGKFRSIALWAGEPAERFLERIDRSDERGQLVGATVFFPDYYRTLLVRLYLFGGRAIVPRGNAYVAELAPAGPSGRRRLANLETHASYEAAVASLAGRDPDRFRLVGLDPAMPCVPLAATALFRPAYRSPVVAYELSGGASASARQVSEVEIFERVEPRGSPELGG